MSKSLLPFIKHSAIPKAFWSDLTNKPFENCISCKCELLGDEVEYVIEKALQSTEVEGVVSTIFEYAMCMPCAGKLRSQLSSQSLKNIDSFYHEKIDFTDRRTKLANNELNITDWIGECIINKRSFKPGEEYQIYGQCIGEHFLFVDMPFMLSGEAVDEMIELISNETMDELDDFMNNLTSGPPEFKELLETGGVKVFIYDLIKANTSESSKIPSLK